MKKAFCKLKNKFNGEDNSKIYCFDVIIMAILVFCYGALSFYHLGSFDIPTTYYNFLENNNSVELKFSDATNVSKLRYYTGYNTGTFKIMASLDGNEFNDVTTFANDSVFSWQDVDLDVMAKYIKFILVDGSCLGDVQFYDDNNRKIYALNVDTNGKVLVDELSAVPDQITFLNSTYFDEIYFVRSAYEYINGISNYEWSHPPLGKLLMTIPILLFGFRPFTFRMMGNIAGILMIPVIYILAMKIFKNRKWAFLAALLMTFDNFHFVQTRIGTIDSFLVLFIMLSVLFMKNYLNLENRNNLFLVAKNLFLSGFFIGCAIATKWNALYAGLGLAIIFFIDLYKQNKDKFKNMFNVFKKFKVIFWCLNFTILFPLVIYYLSMFLWGSSSAIAYTMSYLATLLILSLAFLCRKILKDKYLTMLAFICIIGFIIIPIFIYCTLYLLFPKIDYYEGGLHGIVSQIKLMYNYHTYLGETHPFSSKWYQWIIMYKPIWYYGINVNKYNVSTIACIGNPAIWWGGAISILYLLYDLVKRHDDNSLFILIFIFATLLPYVFVKRVMFMYHFFITLPFMMLSIVKFIKSITEKAKSNIFYSFYIVLIIVMFIIFYPAVSGIIVSQEYINSLKWLSSWIF